MPAFHALLPVRDEADIVAECLRHLLEWADAIYVFDTGSVDETWDIITDYASRETRVMPLRKDDVYYSENLTRGWLFDQARQHMRDGDWFLRVDADEFHHIPPPAFVKTRLRREESVVYHQYYNFCLLESEAAALDSLEKVRQERTKQIAERRRWWRSYMYSEPRLCRYRNTMKWPATVSFPYNAGFIAKERLPIRHYPHRDPIQLERRCRLRAVLMEDKSISKRYWTNASQSPWAENDWTKFVVADGMTGLAEWKDGCSLPNLSNTNHLAPRRKRVAQYVLHRFGVRLIDRHRSGWKKCNYPERIPESLKRRLHDLLR